MGTQIFCSKASDMALVVEKLKWINTHQKQVSKLVFFEIIYSLWDAVFCSKFVNTSKSAIWDVALFVQIRLIMCWSHISRNLADLIFKALKYLSRIICLFLVSIHSLVNSLISHASLIESLDTIKTLQLITWFLYG